LTLYVYGFADRERELAPIQGMLSKSIEAAKLARNRTHVGLALKMGLPAAAVACLHTRTNLAPSSGDARAGVQAAAQDVAVEGGKADPKSRSGSPDPHLYSMRSRSPEVRATSSAGMLSLLVRSGSPTLAARTSCADAHGTGGQVGMGRWGLGLVGERGGGERGGGEAGLGTRPCNARPSADPATPAPPLSLSAALHAAGGNLVRAWRERPRPSLQVAIASSPLGAALAPAPRQGFDPYLLHAIGLPSPADVGGLPAHGRTPALLVAATSSPRRSSSVRGQAGRPPVGLPLSRETPAKACLRLVLSLWRSPSMQFVEPLLHELDDEDLPAALALLPSPPFSVSAAPRTPKSGGLGYVEASQGRAPSAHSMEEFLRVYVHMAQMRGFVVSPLLQGSPVRLAWALVALTSAALALDARAALAQCPEP